MLCLFVHAIVPKMDKSAALQNRFSIKWKTATVSEWGAKLRLSVDAVLVKRTGQLSQFSKKNCKLHPALMKRIGSQNRELLQVQASQYFFFFQTFFDNFAIIHTRMTESFHAGWGSGKDGPIKKNILSLVSIDLRKFKWSHVSLYLIFLLSDTILSHFPAPNFPKTL